jgi:hypothetical protein
MENTDMGEAPELHQSDTEAYSSSKINLDLQKSGPSENLQET